MPRTTRRTPATTSGAAFAAAVRAEHDLDGHEGVLLDQAARTLDVITELDATVSADGAVVDGKPHPAAIEARQQRLVLARLVAQLRFPDDDGTRPQRRGAPRGTYTIGGRA